MPLIHLDPYNRVHALGVANRTEAETLLIQHCTLRPHYGEHPVAYAQRRREHTRDTMREITPSHFILDN